MHSWEPFYRSMYHSRRFTVSFLKNNKQTLFRPRHAVAMETKNLSEQNITSKIIHRVYLVKVWPCYLGRDSKTCSGYFRNASQFGKPLTPGNLRHYANCQHEPLAPTFLIDSRNPISLSISPPSGFQPHCPLHTLTGKPAATPKEGEVYWEWPREAPSDNLMLFTF